MAKDIRVTDDPKVTSNQLADPPASEPDRRRGRSAAARAPSARAAMTGLAFRAAEHASQLLSERMQGPAAEIDQVAKGLRHLGAQLDGHAAGSYMEKAAGQLESIAGLAGEIDSAKVLREVQGFAQRRPLPFLGLAVGLGFLGARFFSSTARSTGKAASQIHDEVSDPGAVPRRRARSNATNRSE